MGKYISRKNPIIPGMGICDPHIHIFNDRAYLYSGHDSSPANKEFIMKDWEIWSSADLVEWIRETVIKPEDTYIGASSSCWATDAAAKNGKYYFYYSNGSMDTGVMISDHPGGPFIDCVDNPVLSQGMTPTKQYDPAVFIDDDENNTPYIVFGTPVWAEGDSYYIARLDENMIALAETPKKIILDDTADDKPFVHKHKGLYYLTWASYYAISDNVYGPYKLIGNLGASADHGSFFEWKNQWFNAFTIYDPTMFYRATGICYIHYKDNGEMVADPMIIENGVGQYDANWNKIEAEWYMASYRTKKLENKRFGFDIGDVTDGSYIYFPNTHNVKKDTGICFYASSVTGGGFIEIRENTFDGELLGICHITNTGTYDWMGYRTFVCNLKNAAGTKNLYFVFKGEGEDILRLDWFKFF